MHTMSSMERSEDSVPENVQTEQEWGIKMEERIYKVMGGSGALNVAVGVVSLVVGVASGVLLLISGAKLLAGRSKILF